VSIPKIYIARNFTLASWQALFYGAGMDLKTYLASNGLKANWFAVRAGVSIAHLSRLVQGRSTPNWETREKIRKASGGEVGPYDWPERAEHDAE
jgi:transcriptional regulator with XRE-family HTH domain